MVFCKVILWPLTVGAPWKHFAALSALLEMFCGILSLHGIFLALVALLQNILRCSGYSLVFLWYWHSSWIVFYGVLNPHRNILLRSESPTGYILWCSQPSFEYSLNPPGTILLRSWSSRKYSVALSFLLVNSLLRYESPL